MLRRVQAGEDITVTVNGKPVARLVAYKPGRRRWLTRTQLMTRIRCTQADPGLRSGYRSCAVGRANGPRCDHGPAAMTGLTGWRP
ncbi:hypothetical protein NGTWS0302_32280 [Mycolicibacterium cyprinidarum]|uniref:Antitoxin n=1 Tax=Mycolicibacterium cyprinidarum TaxID=2860311 RepID=A0ABQ4V8Z2_9MYCO|nr:hypothetical protein NGTWS1702_32750 [Mycolicibacterium sp. NGTWSNA01]GJF12833.1 hypothetical protein NGTWS0302_32280 [Mycolicibacterium sp. NGTWS0302]